MFYGTGLFLLGSAALALAFFARDLTELLRSPLRGIADSLGLSGTKPSAPSTPFAPGPPQQTDPDAPAPLPRRYNLTLQMRAFFVFIGLPLFVIGLLGMWRTTSPTDSDDATGAPASTTSTAITTPIVGCPPVPADLFRVGGFYRRPGMQGPSFQVVDPSVGGDPNALWIDQSGLPVVNPRFPLGPDTVAVADAFGSPLAAVDFNRCALRAVAGG
jgi:hypothetical protein